MFFLLQLVNDSNDFNLDLGTQVAHIVRSVCHCVIEVGTCKRFCISNIRCHPPRQPQRLHSVSGKNSYSMKVTLQNSTSRS